MSTPNFEENIREVTIKIGALEAARKDLDGPITPPEEDEPKASVSVSITNTESFSRVDLTLTHDSWDSTLRVTVAGIWHFAEKLASTSDEAGEFAVSLGIPRVLAIAQAQAQQLAAQIDAIPIAYPFELERRLRQQPLEVFSQEEKASTASDPMK